jgi:hypothetical protein
MFGGIIIACEVYDGSLTEMAFKYPAGHHQSTMAPDKERYEIHS